MHLLGARSAPRHPCMPRIGGSFSLPAVAGQRRPVAVCVSCRALLLGTLGTLLLGAYCAAAERPKKVGKHQATAVGILAGGRQHALHSKAERQEKSKLPRYPLPLTGDAQGKQQAMDSAATATALMEEDAFVPVDGIDALQANANRSLGATNQSQEAAFNRNTEENSFPSLEQEATILGTLDRSDANAATSASTTGADKEEKGEGDTAASTTGAAKEEGAKEEGNTSGSAEGAAKEDAAKDEGNTAATTTGAAKGEAEVNAEGNKTEPADIPAAAAEAAAEQTRPCDCMPEWTYGGGGKLDKAFYRGCSLTPDTNETWCYVVGGVDCKTAKDSEFPGEDRKWQDCKKESGRSGFWQQATDDIVGVGTFAQKTMQNTATAGQSVSSQVVGMSKMEMNPVVTNMGILQAIETWLNEEIHYLNTTAALLFWLLLIFICIQLIYNLHLKRRSAEFGPGSILLLATTWHLGGCAVCFWPIDEASPVGWPTHVRKAGS